MNEPTMFTTSRRALLAFAGFSTALAFGARPKSLRGGEVLPDPDFTELRDSSHYVVGVRPHRKGGVRLELERLGEKYLIHNYGHGGAGITLSFGCAAAAADLVERAALKAPSVAIIGSGVIGLTTAAELKRRWPRLPVTVYAKTLDLTATTSFIAGGQFEPSGIYREYDSAAGKATLASYLRTSRDRIVELQKSGKRELFGVAERKNYSLDHDDRAFDEFTPPDVIPPHRTGLLPFNRLNGPGREYSNWLVNPTLLLPKLAADLAEQGVAFRERDFGARAEVAALGEDVVINCTGYGAKKLFEDQKVVAQRGHLVVLKKTHPKQFYFFSGGCSNPVIAYVFCRQDDIVVGGTVVSGDDVPVRQAADDGVFEKLLLNGRALFAGHVAACRSP